MTFSTGWGPWHVTDCTVPTHHPGRACAHFFTFFCRPHPEIWNRHETTRQNATDAKTPANSTSRRPESNGRQPGPGFGPHPRKKLKLYFAYPSNPGVPARAPCKSRPKPSHAAARWPELLRPQEGGQGEWPRPRGRYRPLSRRGARLRGILLGGIAHRRRCKST